jgi:hypothetical protein
MAIDDGLGPAPESRGCPSCRATGKTVSRPRPGSNRERLLKVCMTCARRARAVWLERPATAPQSAAPAA